MTTFVDMLFNDVRSFIRQGTDVSQQLQFRETQQVDRSGLERPSYRIF